MCYTLTCIPRKRHHTKHRYRIYTIWPAQSTFIEIFHKFFRKNYLPRDEDKIMSGYFGLVAIWVTHPLWPNKVPRLCNVSVIFLSKNTFLKLCKTRLFPSASETKKNEYSATVMAERINGMLNSPLVAVYNRFVLTDASSIRMTANKCESYTIRKITGISANTDTPLCRISYNNCEIRSIES